MLWGLLLPQFCLPHTGTCWVHRGKPCCHTAQQNANRGADQTPDGEGEPEGFPEQTLACKWWRAPGCFLASRWASVQSFCFLVPGRGQEAASTPTPCYADLWLGWSELELLAVYLETVKNSLRFPPVRSIFFFFIFSILLASFLEEKD